MINRLKSYRNGVHGAFFLEVAAEIETLRALEKQYSNRLGEMARLCDICIPVLLRQDLDEEPGAREAAEEIMEYVDQVRP